jgi:uncharacterized membrane protein YfcA
MMAETLAFLATGALAGVCSGIFGIGGGVILVPMLVMAFGYAQITATGTSLVALLLPVGLLGVLNFYYAGKIDATNIKAGLLIAAGIFVGTYAGSLISIPMNENVLKKLFAVLLLALAIRMWFFTK